LTWAGPKLLATLSHQDPGSPSAQVIVLSPHGTTPYLFPFPDCAWHSWTTDPFGNFVAFTNMPYVLDAGSGCGANRVLGPLDGFSIVAGHEYAETLTDPALNAWYDTSLSGEIGDKCVWVGLFAEPLSTGFFPQQALWDNLSSSCID
jgi:serine protease